MSGNVLWTQVFNKPGSQSQELTRQRIVQEERCGRRPASIIPGPAYEAAMRGRGTIVPVDPWAPQRDRHQLPPPIVGYGGTMPRVRPEHTGKNMGEQAAEFKYVQQQRAASRVRFVTSTSLSLTLPLSFAQAAFWHERICVHAANGTRRRRLGARHKANAHPRQQNPGGRGHLRIAAGGARGRPSHW